MSQSAVFTMCVYYCNRLNSDYRTQVTHTEKNYVTAATVKEHPLKYPTINQQDNVDNAFNYTNKCGLF